MRWPRFAILALAALGNTCLIAAFGSGTALAADLRIAVAANFRAPLEVLVNDFAAQAGHDVAISSGATGLLYAQISRGAPFDVYLAADLARPQTLISDGIAVKGSLQTYARGRLVVLITPGAEGKVSAISDLGSLRRVAIANPRTAPYGRAAEQVLAANGLDLSGRLAIMQNVSGVVSAVQSRAVGAGIAPRSALEDLAELRSLDVPEHQHDPIEQGAVLLTRAADNIAARAFLDYLASEAAQSTIRDFGYDVD
ncbi:MAG: molybdate ABC transporter substrate-binding protein [Pseudomonadota bacterium]